jgi:hypothetical protein
LWEWLVATIIGCTPTELIAVKNRSHNQNPESQHLQIILGPGEAYAPEGSREKLLEGILSGLFLS